MAAELVSAMIGFGGAILGGLIQSGFSYRQSHAQFVRDSRQRDYNVFVEAIAGLSQAVPNSVERRNFGARSIEAKGKIILNGSPDVIEALEKYSSHAVLYSEESYTDFCRLIAAMRADIGGENPVTLMPRLRAILFEKPKP